jgi:hypothetical protein
MLVALVFTMVLMAGMASVFKASLSTFFTSGEGLASVRRNRLSVDMLGQDLDTACMYLTDLTNPPATNQTTPPFYILPNMPIDGVSASPAATDPTSADQLFFQLDQALPFEGILQSGGGSASAASLVADGGTLPASNTILVECGSDLNASLVVQGLAVIFKDTFEIAHISAAPTFSAGVEDKSVATVTLGADSNAAITGTGSTGILKGAHLTSSRVVFALPAQVVRYQVQYLNLDPNGGGTTIPCLVRDQGTYQAGLFTPSGTQQIITENVQSFKVYLSVNAGQNWAGFSQTYKDFTKGWTNGILSELTTQLTGVVTNGFTAITGNINWFRSIPTVVRVDIATRTASQRTEYFKPNDPNNPSNIANPHQVLTQSLIFVPRHSGLPMN